MLNNFLNKIITRVAKMSDMWHGNPEEPNRTFICSSGTMTSSNLVPSAHWLIAGSLFGPKRFPNPFQILTIISYEQI